MTKWYTMLTSSLITNVPCQDEIKEHQYLNTYNYITQMGNSRVLQSVPIKFINKRVLLQFWKKRKRSPLPKHKIKRLCLNDKSLMFWFIKNFYYSVLLT